MKSVLEFLGFFLYLGYRLVMLPIFSMLYAMLALVVAFNFMHYTVQQVPAFGQKVVAGLQVARFKFRLVPKWQFGVLSK